MLAGLAATKTTEAPVLFLTDFLVIVVLIIWATKKEKVHIDRCAQRRHPRRLITVFVLRDKKLCIISYPNCAQWRFWSACANAQIVLNLRWAHIPESAFSDVAAEVLSVEIIRRIVGLTSPKLRGCWWRHTPRVIFLETPGHIFNRILMYLERQYFPCLLANDDEALFILFLSLKIIKVKFQVPQTFYFI